MGVGLGFDGGAVANDGLGAGGADAVRRVAVVTQDLPTGRIGATKPVAFIEDAAVRPAQLPDYIRGLKSIIESLGLEASYYGHAASGLLHVRPVLDLHNAADL